MRSSYDVNSYTTAYSKTEKSDLIDELNHIKYKINKSRCGEPTQKITDVFRKDVTLSSEIRRVLTTRNG